MRQLALPLAIVLAGGFIGAGLYLGLRARPVAAVPPMREADASADLVDAIARAKPEWLNRCPFAANSGLASGAQLELAFDASFAADGHQIALGISTPRTSPPNHFAACLRRLEISLAIAPRAQPSHAQAVARFP